jgi:hypothetical protein
MRLEAAIGGLVLSASVICSSLLERNELNDVHFLAKRIPSPTVKLVKRSGDGVFNVAQWPTVSVPAGFTLAAGIEITPVPAMAVTGVSGSAALESAVAAATPSVDPAAWNIEADQSCQAAIDQLGGLSSSQSGMAACYNVPFLDQTTGTFESELRIYNVSAPTGGFVGAAIGSMSISMTYSDAAFSEFNGSLASRSLEARQISSTGVRQGQLVSIKRYIGQIDSSVFNSSTTS